MGHARAIAASLQHDARFAKPAYYINVLFAMVVRFGNTSSPCERWAHELKLLWNPEKTQCTSTLMHRLQGRVAGFRGDGTDEALLEALERQMTLDPAKRAAHNVQRNRRGIALATWWAEKRREFEQHPARTFFQRALSAPTGLRRSHQLRQPKDARGESAPEQLEDLDRDLLSRIRLRERGVSAPGSAQKALPDLGSVMPWHANTGAQWKADLAKPRRLVLTSDRAADFFDRRNEGRPPLPRSRSPSPTSSASASTSSSSASVSSEALAPRVLSGTPADTAIAWAHKGGVCRIHGLEGSLSDGTARQACKPLQQLVTSAWQTGNARAKEEAVSATQNQWSKTCFKLLW